MPTKIEFDLSELGLSIEKLNKKLHVWYDAALTDYALMIEEMIVDEIDARNISVSGELKKSITHEVTKKTNGWLVRIGTNLKTGSGYPYPVGVEAGTIKHLPPIDPIREWVRLKLNITEKNELNEVSRAIQVSISKKGTKPNPFMGSVFAKEKFKIHREIGRAMLRVMRGGKFA